MSESQIALPQGGSGTIGALGFIEQVFKTLRKWRFRYTSRRDLRALNAHLMTDIGIDPSEAMRESFKPFWKA